VEVAGELSVSLSAASQDSASSGAFEKGMVVLRLDGLLERERELSEESSPGHCVRCWLCLAVCRVGGCTSGHDDVFLKGLLHKLGDVGQPLSIHDALQHRERSKLCDFAEVFLRVSWYTLHYPRALFFDSFGVQGRDTTDRAATSSPCFTPDSDFG